MAHPVTPTGKVFRAKDNSSLQQQVLCARKKGFAIFISVSDPDLAAEF